MATASLGTGRTRAAAIIEQSPGLVPTSITLAVLLWFAGDEGGFRTTTSLPATLLLVALLFVCLIALPRPQPSRPALVAVLLLSGYAAWSLLSILWAAQEDLAWEGGNRTLLYAVILALCTLWPLRGEVAVALLGAFGLGIAGIALVELLRASAADQSIQYFSEARFSEPVGYANANVALWMLGLFPCAILAGRRGLPAPLRGLFLGAAVLLAGAALLGQSRGWLIALPVVGVVAILAVPGRGRTIVSFGAVGLGLLIALRPLLDVYENWHPHQPLGDDYSSALRWLLLASLLLAVLGTTAALLERRVELPAATARRISAGLVAAVIALGCVGALGYWVVKENPVTAVSNAWDDFKKGGVGPNETNSTSRFSGSVSTYRYDYWRVAWAQFKEHPLVGAGADNFGRAYVRHGESNQTPRFPHSTFLVALEETGLIGFLLLFGSFAAAVAAALPALRRPSLAAAAAGSGVVMFAYWLAHSSVDWLWEFPALSGAALLGLGVAMAAARGLAAEAADAAPADRGSAPARPLLAPWPALAGAIACVAAIGVSVVPAWLSAKELRRATEIAATDPDAAVRDLDRAASLNPLSPLPEKAAGIIEIRRGDSRAARRHLLEAFDRDPHDSGVFLFLGAIASEAGHQRKAIRLAAEALRLAPTDDSAYNFLRRLRDRERITPRQMDRWIQKDVNYRISPE
jgi:tetratricopeptide (TPR) repeat protein